MWDKSLDAAIEQRKEIEAQKAQEPKSQQQEEPKEQSKVEDTPAEEPKAQGEVQSEQPAQEEKKDKTTEEQKPVEAPKAQEEQKVDDFEERFRAKLEEEGYIPKDKYEEDLSSRFEINNDFIKRLVELDKEGVEINEKFLTSYFEDLDRYNLKSPSDLKSVLVRQKMQDGYTKEDAELVVETEFEEVFSQYADAESREFRVQKVKAETQARKFIESLKENKDKLAIPSNFESSDAVKKYISEQERLSQEKAQEAEKFLTDVANRVHKNLESVKVDVSGVEVQYDVPQETKKKVKEAIKGYNSFLNDNFITEEGLNENALAEFLTFYFDKDKILETVSGQFKSVGKEEAIDKEVKNANFEPKQKGEKQSTNNVDKIPVQFRSFINK